VSVGDVLVEIPKAWCLTPRTGSVSLAIPEEELEDLDEAALILAVMYERAKGEASAWWPYFKRLPQDHEPIRCCGARMTRNTRRHGRGGATRE
jgi:hypothetical protein